MDNMEYRKFRDVEEILYVAKDHPLANEPYKQIIGDFISPFSFNTAKCSKIRSAALCEQNAHNKQHRAHGYAAVRKIEHGKVHKIKSNEIAHIAPVSYTHLPKLPFRNSGGAEPICSAPLFEMISKTEF